MTDMIKLEELAGLLVREGRYSGVWFGPQLIKGAEALLALSKENAALKEALGSICTMAGLARVFHGQEDGTDRALANIIGRARQALGETNV